METFNFVGLSDTELEVRCHHLGQHVLILAEGSERRQQVEREINNLVFEMAARADEEVKL